MSLADTTTFAIDLTPSASFRAAVKAMYVTLNAGGEREITLHGVRSLFFDQSGRFTRLYVNGLDTGATIYPGLLVNFQALDKMLSESHGRGTLTLKLRLAKHDELDTNEVVSLLCWD